MEGLRLGIVWPVGRNTEALIRHAKASGGVVTRPEALALGVPSSTLDRLVKKRFLERVLPGVFVLAGTPDESGAILHAACRKLGAVVSHMSAARLHLLETPGNFKPTVSVPRRRTKVFPGVTVHQLTDMLDEHVQSLKGLPVTIPERTVIDLAATTHPARLERLVDHGLAAGKIDLDRLSELFTQLGRRGKPGTRAMRTVLARRESGYVAPESELERRLSALIEDADLPEPERQYTPSWLVPAGGRVDLAYPGHRLVIEADGRRWHTLLNSFEIDRHRDNAAQLAGWRILRFTWAEVTRNPNEVIASIRRALST